MKQIKPMLIKHEQPPFDDDDYIYELKLDGIRCIAHLTKTSTDLRNKRTQKLLPKFPELTQLHKQIKKSCIFTFGTMLSNRFIKQPRNTKLLTQRTSLR